MGLDVRSPIDFMHGNQQLIDQMMQSRLNRLYAEPERQAQLNSLQAQSAAMADTLASQNAFRNASAQNLNNPFRINQMLSSAGKHVLEPQLLNALQSGQMSVPQLNQLMTQQGAQGQSQQQGMQLPVNEQQLDDYYAAQRQKSASDVGTRNRVKFSTNIEKTIQNIGEPKFFEKYTGVGGQARLLKEKANAATGKASPDFKNWNNFVHVQVPILSGQIRQFYGDSIQPQVREELQKMENPEYWYANPELAYSQYNTLIDLLRSEAQTYNTALNAPTMTSDEAITKPLPPKSKLGEKEIVENIVEKIPTKTYSQRLGNEFKEMISSGRLTKEYYLSLPREQQAAIRKQMGAK